MSDTFLPDLLILLAWLTVLGALLFAGELALRLIDRRNRLARFIERLSNK